MQSETAMKPIGFNPKLKMGDKVRIHGQGGLLEYPEPVIGTIHSLVTEMVWMQRADKDLPMACAWVKVGTARSLAYHGKLEKVK